MATFDQIKVRTIAVYTKTDKRIDLEVTNAAFKNIGGAVITLYILPKPNSAEGDALVTKVAVHDDELGGKCHFELDTTDTNQTAGNYAYKVKGAYPTGNTVILDSGTIFFKTLNDDILKQRVVSELGISSWQIELSESDYQVAVSDALRKLSRRIPILRFNYILLTPNTRKYVLPEDVGYGVIRVDFVQPDPKPVAVFYANLLDVAPLKTAYLDNYDIFLRWRKTFMRITSVQPKWMYEPPNILWLYNPVHNVQAGYYWHMPRTSLDQVLPSHEDFVYEYTLARCQLIVGRARSKFQGALPGPSKDLTTDGVQLVEAATQKIKDLEDDLLKMQHDQPPIIS